MASIGAHLGIGKGLKRTADQAVDMGLECLQIFLRNPRGSKARQLMDDEVAYFKRVLSEHRINPLAVHVSYVCNPAADDPGIYQLAKTIVTEDLWRAAQIGADYLVLHPGSYTKSSLEQGIKRVANLLNEVLGQDENPVTVLLETMSGQGTEVGRSFAELNEIIRMVTPSGRVGVCYDTCHTFAAGYDCRGREALEAILSELDSTFGRERIKLIHANDCKSELGSRRDRHAHIGEGNIGIGGFEEILAHPFWSSLPMVLETPAVGLSGDVDKLKMIRRKTAKG